MSLLEPGPTPEPYESLIALAGAAHDLGITPKAAAEIVAGVLVPVDPTSAKTGGAL